jgi:hypothetical protein
MSDYPVGVSACRQLATLDSAVDHRTNEGGAGEPESATQRLYGRRGTRSAEDRTDQGAAHGTGERLLDRPCPKAQIRVDLAGVSADELARRLGVADDIAKAKLTRTLDGPDQRPTPIRCTALNW